MLIEDALRRYLVQLQADGRSPHTLKQYQRHVRLLARWLEGEGRDQEVETIDHEVLALFLVSDAATRRPDGRPKKATAMNTLRSSLRTFFGYLHAAGYVAANPARLIRPARCGTPPPRALSTDEQGRLLAALDAAATPEERRDRVLFRLMLATGIRIGSALGLDVEDVDLENGDLWLRRTKGDRPDRAFLPQDTVALLREHLANPGMGPLFTGRGGRRLSARHVQRRLRTRLVSAGITRPASPHSLRHTMATRLYEATGDVLLVKSALGHRSILSSVVYAQAVPRRLREALEAC